MQLEVLAVHAVAHNGYGTRKDVDPNQLTDRVGARYWHLIEVRGEELVDRFYDNLFRKAPSVRALFARTDMHAQKRALLGALVALRRSLRDLPSIAPFLAELGARHANYGVRPEHYQVVGAALLETMANLGGSAWQPSFTAEWACAYQAVAKIMVDGAEQAAPSAYGNRGRLRSWRYLYPR
jgi:hemoglobin-like flavoprotein